MSGATHRYRAHGLTFDSDIELPELVPFDGEPDVMIRYGQVPERLEGPVTHGPGYQATAGHYLLDLPGMARYLVREGRDVIIAPAPGAREDDVRVFVLSSVMAALVHQKGLLAMHASAVEVDGRCVLFAGESGAGKSTLTAAFHNRGYRIVTDDLSVVSFDRNGVPMVPPGYRHVKLRPDSLELVGASLGARREMQFGVQKFSVAVPGAAPLAPLRLARMFMLSTRTAEAIALRDFTGRSKVAALLKATYRRRMLIALGQRATHFAQCTALGRCIPVGAVDRPPHLDGLQRLVDVLEDDIRAGSGARA